MAARPRGGYFIRPHRPDDDATLVVIEHRAAQLFRGHGYPQIADQPVTEIAEFREAFGGDHIWVAAADNDLPVGFAVAAPLGRYAHLRELSVDPAHGRRGLGAALVKSVIEAADADDAHGVSLTTFRSLPFNQPFYERLGFREMTLSDAPPLLRDAFFRELPPNVEAPARLLMHRPRAGTWSDQIH